MSTEYQEIAIALAQPFHPSEIKTLTKGGKAMPYVTARVVMNRLDEVMGVENWWDEYIPGENSVTCKLSLMFPNKRVVTKADAGAYAGMSDQGDDDKSGFSDAFKRAAVKFGIGRHLYNDGLPIYPEERKPVPLEDSLPAGSKPSKNNKHPNNSGHGHGQYASDAQVAEYLKRLNEKLYGTEKEPGGLNGQWADHWVDPKTGEFPNVKACTNDVLTVYQADAHLVKWLVDTGRIDPDALEKNGKPNMLGKHAAIVMFRGGSEAAAMKAELDRYMVETFEAKKMAIYHKHRELAPDGFAEELAEADGKGEAYEGPDPAHEGQEPPPAAPSPAVDGPPARSGRALFAWLKEQEQRHEVGLLKYINAWAKLREFPGRVVDWDSDQVSEAYSEAVRKLQTISADYAQPEEAMA